MRGLPGRGETADEPRAEATPEDAAAEEAAPLDVGYGERRGEATGDGSEEGGG